MTKQEFITQIADYVQKYAPQYGIRCCSAVIAQAILESGWGESRLAAQYHNYFGLKGSKTRKLTWRRSRRMGTQRVAVMWRAQWQ